MARKRTIYGRAYPASPEPRRSFGSEVTLYRWLAEGLRELHEVVPHHERGLFTALVELRAYCDERRRACQPAEESMRQTSMPFDGT